MNRSDAIGAVWRETRNELCRVVDLFDAVFKSTKQFVILCKYTLHTVLFNSYIRVFLYFVIFCRIIAESCQC